MRSVFLLLCLAVFTATWAQPDLLGGDPLSTAPSSFSSQSHGLSPTGLWSDTSVPLPTNAWWQNMVLGGGTNTVNALPYLLQAHNDGLRFGFSGKVVEQNYIFTYFTENLSFGAVNGLPARQVTDYGPLHVRMSWGNGPGSMAASLVRGMAFVSAEYEALTPRLGTVHAITSVNGGSASSPNTNTRFEVGLNNGQTWVIYASSSITLSVSGGALVASGPFTGTLRAAVLQDGGDSALLDAHAGRTPTGGSVSATATGDMGELTFNWESTGSGPLLMMALPHHMDVLSSPTTVSLVRNTMKGDMTGIVGNTWTMAEPLTTIAWDSPNGISADLEQDVRDALAQDVGFAVTAPDPYFGGKQFSALARLALIADELGETSLANTYRSNLAPALQQRLAGSNGDPLLYDQSWGGLVVSSGINNPSAAFGQGYYNDHHFHYGYWIYAAAAMAKDNPAWVAEWGDEVLELIRDIAEPSGSDAHFGYMRNKDWFVGHSWAAGLFEFGDSRNQESSSEAVNAWYGVYLYGLAIGDDRIRDLGRMMLATELRATWKYWQINAGEGIYPEPYASNKVVGILWGMKVDYTTFFGANVEFIHGIQMLPYTPITEELLRAEWIEEEYPVVAAGLNNPSIGEGWKGFIYMAHAVIDPVEAWNEASTLNGYDDGNTKTNTLYWLATRPGVGDGGGNGGGGTVLGCTDSDAVNYNSSANSNDGSCVFPVTLSVDMNDPSSPDGPVFLAGTFNGWDATAEPLFDPEGDGVWTVTMNWSPGLYEYKFTTFDWGASEQFSGGESCTLTTGEFVNRLLTVDDAVTLPAVCWESCETCSGGCPADLDEDGICDTVDDCIGVLDAIGECNGTCAEDLDEDGICDTVDDCVGVLDACGICNGLGAIYDCGCADIPMGDCDCEGGQGDALGECGGNCQSDSNANGICDLEEQAGCTYEVATNYSVEATMDDGSCLWGPVSCAEDVNLDGLVGVSDILLVLSSFGEQCQ
jgi:endo-1,3(4)-beta-glucanase